MHLRNNNDQTCESVIEREASSIIIGVNRSFQFYKTGVFNDAACPKSTNHAVTEVGYDTLTSAALVKNSWGSNWGENGYIRMDYKQNTCGCRDWLDYGEKN